MNRVKDFDNDDAFSRNLIWDVEEVKEDVECCKIFDKAALCTFPMTLYQDD